MKIYDTLKAALLGLTLSLSPVAFVAPDMAHAQSLRIIAKDTEESLNVAQNLGFQARLADRSDKLDLARLAAELGLAEHLSSSKAEKEKREQRLQGSHHAIFSMNDDVNNLDCGLE